MMEGMTTGNGGWLVGGRTAKWLLLSCRWDPYTSELPPIGYTDVPSGYVYAGEAIRRFP
jgi:hypothetical protein